MKRFRKLAFAIIGLLSWWPGPSAHAEPPDPSAEQILAAHEKYLDAYRRAAITVNTKVTAYHAPTLPSGTLIEDSQHKLWRDGDRWKLHIRATKWFPIRKGSIQKRTYTDEKLYPGIGMIRVERPDPTHPHFVTAYLDELPERERRATYAYLFAAIFGLLDYNDGLLLPEILRSSRLSVRGELMDGRQVWLLEGVGNWGYHALWLDPEQGYMPRRIEQRKKGTDWLERNKSVESFPIAKSAFYPEAKLLEKTQTLAETTSEQVDGINVLTGFTLTETSHFEDYQPITLKAIICITATELNPDLSKSDTFTIVTPIQDGTRVQVRDRPNIVFEWRDGKIIKSINQKALANSEGISFLRGRFGRGILAIITLILTAMSATWCCYRLRLRRSKS